MTKTKIENLIMLLLEAKEKGCKQVKLQLYEKWEDVKKEQDKPSHPVEEYLVDTRFYNTVEFATEIINMEATDKILTKVDGDTLIIRVSLSDRDALLNNLGIAEFYN